MVSVPPEVIKLERLLERRPIRVLVRATDGCIEDVVTVLRASARIAPSVSFRLVARPVQESESCLPAKPRPYFVDLPFGLFLSPQKAADWVSSRIRGGIPVPIAEYDDPECERCHTVVRTPFCPGCGEQMRALIHRRPCTEHDGGSSRYCGRCGDPLGEFPVGSARLGCVD